ncbi:hypothetical protein V6N12_063261 [Hibiscus sabdariffa]|uniref:Uncharacterized protein n=1 Tax=Hibiscus sabdariffa TaxID=183260 RepID=A0ABR2FBB5_9ROSI
MYHIASTVTVWTQQSASGLGSLRTSALAFSSHNATVSFFFSPFNEFRTISKARSAFSIPPFRAMTILNETSSMHLY